MIENPDYKGISDKMLPVRCGKCEGCLKSKINDWAFRLEQEAKVSLYVHFVTLTYTPDYVPLTESILPTLSKSDLQKFFKRLRKINENDRIKYFAVGEYGSRSYRPHYHIILFNCSNVENIYKAWAVNGHNLGHVHIGDSISNGAIPYTLKYMYKKGLVPAFAGDDRLPEFRLMSQKLGDNYLSPNMVKWHLNNLKERQYARNDSGFNIALPRRFRDKLIELSGKPKSMFRNEESVFMSSDDGDPRSLSSRVVGVKQQIKKFEKKRNQEQRKKI